MLVLQEGALFTHTNILMEMFSNKIILLDFFILPANAVDEDDFKSKYGNWKLTQNHQASIYSVVEKFSCLTIQLDSSNYVNDLQIRNYNQNAYAVTERNRTSTCFCYWTHIVNTSHLTSR